MLLHLRLHVFDQILALALVAGRLLLLVREHRIIVLHCLEVTACRSLIGIRPLSRIAKKRS